VHVAKSAHLEITQVEQANVLEPEGTNKKTPPPKNDKSTGEDETVQCCKEVNMNVTH